MTTTQDLCPGVSSHSVSTRKLRVLATVQHLFPQSARDGNSQPRLARAPTIATWPRRAVGANAVRPWPARSDEPSQRASTGARSNRSSLRTVISAWPVTNTAISLTSSLAPSVSGWVTADALRNRCVAYRSNLGRCEQLSRVVDWVVCRSWEWVEGRPELQDAVVHGLTEVGEAGQVAAFGVGGGDDVEAGEQSVSCCGGAPAAGGGGGAGPGGGGGAVVG